MSSLNKMIENPLNKKEDLSFKSPQKLLAEINQKYSGLWRFIDEKRAERKNEEDKVWPEWCFAPVFLWENFLKQNPSDETKEKIFKYKDQITEMAKEFFKSVAEGRRDYRKESYFSALTSSFFTKDKSLLMTLGAWRPTQSICHFEKELGESLIGTSFTGDIPSEVFLRLPEWCTYIDTSNFNISKGGIGVNGFFVSLDKGHSDDEQASLFFYYNLANGEAETLFFALGDWPIEESIARYNDMGTSVLHSIEKIDGIAPETLASFKNTAEEMKVDEKLLSISLNFTLYLCSKAPDIINSQNENKWGQSHPVLQKTKKGYRIFPPDKPVEWIVGEKLEKQVQLFATKQEKIQKEEGKTHASPRPHIRKAHWHGYWTGPKDKPQVFELKFLHPIPVALSEDTPPDEKGTLENLQKQTNRRIASRLKP